MSGPNLDGYVDVATRLRLALERFPDLRAQAGAPSVVTVESRTFVSVTVTVWRSPDDPLPAIASAWEPFPGRTPFTRDSEMMNAETSALGRALGLVGIGIDRSLSSSDEVLTRKADEAGRPADTPPRAEVGSRRPAAGSRTSSAPRPATAKQVDLLRRLAAERGIELGPLDGITAEDASREIDSLKQTEPAR